MGIVALGYVGVNSAHLDDWDGFATKLLGMQRVDAAAGVRAYRMDDRRQRLVVSSDGGERLGVMGWEVDGAAALDALASRLDNHGVPVQRGTRGLAGERHVRDLVVFDDPAGNRLEAFHGPAVSTEAFTPGRPISGFVTGALGMGHVVLNVPDAEVLLPFYRDMLGFNVTDFGLQGIKLYFMHVNGRHHSFALAGSGRHGLHHFMVEVGSIDDVGQGYDLAQVQEDRIAYTLGRHSNDYMVSFYAHTPSGFFVEYGWGGRVIDPATWQPHETFDGPSFWGHERLHLDPAQRNRMRDLRMDAAARGVRAPMAPTNCPWLDAVISQE
jgi:2,3-dihydroxybiphenyl 1,2-dioxygenase